MARKSNTRAAQGAGSIRQRSDGTWEARITIGNDPGTGKQIRLWEDAEGSAAKDDTGHRRTRQRQLF